MIQRAQFKHGWYYDYRVHTLKSEYIKGKFPALLSFLQGVFRNCPNDYFQSGPRGSRLKFSIDANPVCITGHEVSTLARKGLEINENRYKSNHMKVQTFMLENDMSTIAMEVPLWFQPEEMQQYSTIFETAQPLTGHIDLLRVEDGKIWIWDYKPVALKEKFATTQTYFYALMLSLRTGIPLEHFRCGYFDSYYAFVFKPEMSQLLRHATAKKLDSF